MNKEKTLSIFRSVTATLVAAMSCISLTAYTNLGNNTLSSDGSASDTQAAISAGSDGYTVRIPAGTFTWTSPVSIPGKGIKLEGAGSGRVIARSTSSISIGNGTITAALNSSGLPITNGQTLRLYRTGGIIANGNPTGVIGWMEGTVTGYSGTTLTMQISSSNGSGTHSLWIVTTQANTTINHSAGSNVLVSITEGTGQSPEMSGLRFVTGTGKNDYVNMNFASNGEPISIHDCYFESTVNFDCIQSNTNRGMIYRNSFVALPISMAQLGVHLKDAPASSWNTSSTMGTADTNGKNNLYVEDCDFHAWLNAADIDDNGRCVWRYNLMNNSGFGTHGADTSNYGVRHYEVYNCEFVFNAFKDGSTMNINWWFYLRGGTGVITDNIMPDISSQDYGNKTEINMTVMNLQRNGGPNAGWGSNIPGIQYPCPRQVGMGRISGSGKDGLGRLLDSIIYVGESEPLYIWNNTGNYSAGTSDYGGNDFTNPDSSASYIVAARDYFNNGSAKPGYTKYPYPHPLRSVDISPPPSTTPPSNAKIIITAP